MKKLIFILLAATILFSISACNRKIDNETTIIEEPVESIPTKPTETPKTAEWTITCTGSETSDFASYTKADFEDLEMHIVDYNGIQYEGYYLFDVFSIMNPNQESMIVSAAVEFNGSDVFMFTLVDILNEVEAYMIIKESNEFCSQPILYANEKIYDNKIMNVVILS